MRDGADALRTARPEVGTAKSDGEVTRRKGFVTDLDVTCDTAAETAACGRARRRIGNGTFDVPGTDGYGPGHDFGHGRGGPADLPTVPDLPASAAHTACDPGEADRQRARPPPMWPSPMGLCPVAVTGVPPARRRPGHPETTPQTPTGPPTGNTNGNCRLFQDGLEYAPTLCHTWFGLRWDGSGSGGWGVRIRSAVRLKAIRAYR